MIWVTNKPPSSHHFSPPNPTRLNDQSRPCMIIPLFTLLSLSLPFLSTDDKGNFLIQWLSKANPEFPAPKISSSKRPLSSGQAAVCAVPAPACHLAFSLALWLCYTLPWLLLLSGACCLSLPLLLLLFKEFRGLYLPGSPPLIAHLGSESIRSLRVTGSRCNGQWGMFLWSDESLFGCIIDREVFFYSSYTRQQSGVLEIVIPVRLWRGGLYYILKAYSIWFKSVYIYI